jgi:hypothetical protein
VKEARVKLASLAFRRGFLAPSLTPVELGRVLAAGAEMEPLDRLSFFSAGPDAGRAELLLRLGESIYREALAGVTFERVADADAIALARSGCLARLEHLSAYSGSVTDAGACALGGWRAPGRLAYVDLRCHRIGDEGAAALARSPLLSAVRHLMLDANRIGDAGAAALAESPHLERVAWVTLTNNPIGPAGWRRLWDRFGNRAFPRPGTV